MNLAAVSQSVFGQIFASTPVVHFANSGDATSGDPKTYDKILGIQGGRAQVCLRQGDFMVYPDAVLAHQQALARYHRKMGLSALPEDRVVGIPGSILRNLSANFRDLSEADRALLRDITKQARLAEGRLLPYIASPGSRYVAEQLGLSHDPAGHVGRALNNKWFVKKGIQRLNDRAGEVLIPTPPGREVKSLEAAWRIFLELLEIAQSDPRSDGRVWVKINCSGGGYGVRGVSTLEELEAWLAVPHVRDAFAKKGIQGGVHMDVGIDARDVDPSPSVGLWIGDRPASDRYLSGQYQLFAADGKEWIANVGPLFEADDAKVRAVLPHIFNWLRSQGGRGFCGIDFIFGRDGTLYLIEVNFRITGAMATAFVAKERGAPAWIAANEIPVPWHTSLEVYLGHLAGNGLLLGPESPTSGVFVLNMLPALDFGNDYPVVQGGILAATRAEAEDILRNGAPVVRAAA